MRKAVDKFIEVENECLGEVIKLGVKNWGMDHEEYQAILLLMTLLEASNDLMIKQADEYDELTDEIGKMRRQLCRMESKMK